MPFSSRRRTRPREVLVVLVESLRWVEDSARERERRRGVGGPEDGRGEKEEGVGGPREVLL